MNKRFLTAILTLICASSARCDTYGYVSSYDGMVYKINLDRGKVEAKIHVGGHPFFVSMHKNLLFLDGARGSIEEGDKSQIQVFDVEKMQTLKTIPTGSICCSLMTENEIVYAQVEPSAELNIIDLRNSSLRSVKLPEHFLPGALARSKKGDEVLVLASEYESVGIPKLTLCYVVSTSGAMIVRSFELPLWSESIVQTQGRMVVSTSVNSPNGPPFFFFYGDLTETPKWTRFEIPFFCEQYGNRQHYFVSSDSNYFVYSAGDCPGDAELEEKEPTLFAFDRKGSLIWSVTEKADQIPDSNSIAPLPDGRIVFVSRGWGIGVFDPHTRKLVRRISVGDDSSLWGIAVQDGK